jgi:hypothetical protein
MIRLISKLLDRAFVVVGALVLSQTPLFMQQYTQQLSGHVSELHLQIDAMRRVASHSNKSLEQYIQKFLNSTDDDFRGQGEIMRGVMERWAYLNDGLQAFQTAKVWERPYIFVKYFSWEIGTAAYHNYRIGIAFTLESLIYALAGMILGYLLFLILRTSIRMMVKPRLNSVNVEGV